MFDEIGYIEYIIFYEIDSFHLSAAAVYTGGDNVSP